VLFGAVAGWGLWFWLIARCSMTRLAPFALLQVVFAVAAGVVFLNERLTPSLVVGAVLCIIGVAISQSRSAARPGVSRAIWTAPREAERTRPACGIRTP
jgi:O-acetylserine/cysteine efflux transporter